MARAVGGLVARRRRRRPAAMPAATVAGFLLGFAVIWGTMFALGLDTPTGIERGLVAAGGTLVVAAAAQRIVFGTSLSAAPNALGLGRPPVRSLVAAAAVSVCLFALYPVYSAATHTTLTLRDGWPWLAVNLFAYHGMAEEVAWRGYAFGRLRRGHSFRRAVALTMPLIAVTHLPVLASAGGPGGMRRHPGGCRDLSAAGSSVRTRWADDLARRPGARLDRWLQALRLPGGRTCVPAGHCGRGAGSPVPGLRVQDPERCSAPEPTARRVCGNRAG